MAPAVSRDVRFDQQARGPPAPAARVGGEARIGPDCVMVVAGSTRPARSRISMRRIPSCSVE